MNGIGPDKARLLEAHRIRWEFGFNDPTLIGWLTVAGYILAAVLAWRSASAARQAGTKFDRIFWLAICSAMALLAVNKQLDLHVLVTDIGRYWAVQNDLYQQRRAFQKAFIAAIVMGAGGAGLALWLATRGKGESLRLAVAGLAICCDYILMRAASFHHADVLMQSELLGLRWNGFVELAGVATIALAAWRYRPG